MEGESPALMKLFLTNSGQIKIFICFSLILSLPLLNPFLIADVISLPGTGRYLQLTSLTTLHRNRVPWRWPMPGHILHCPTVRKTKEVGKRLFSTSLEKQMSKRVHNSKNKVPYWNLKYLKRKIVCVDDNFERN